MNRNTVVLAIATIMATATGCKHEPLLPYVDDTTPPDTTTDCDPSLTYFQNDVMPIFASSCAMTGCHDAATAEEGVILTNYANIMNTGEVDPGNPNSSEVFDVIMDSDPDKKMPPPSSGITLSQDQINTINDWISQGALNNFCAESGPCDTVAVSFAADIQPILSANCLGCHSGTAPQGGISLSSHSAVMNTVNSNRLLGAVEQLGGYSAMPKNQPRMADCKVALIRNWIAQGAPNN
jgi:uncharacterized membrane protein